MKKQNFLHGSAALILSAMLTKLLGAIFRIPLANMLGGAGMGYFACAYGIFLPVYAVSVTGIPAAIAKLTAENSALERFGNVIKIKRVSLAAFGFASLLLTAITAVFAYPFCVYIARNPSAFPAALVIAPAVFFGTVTAVYRGHYEGLRNMYPTALSQVAEALAKLTVGLLLCRLALERYKDSPAVMVYAAAAAVLGVTLSTLAGMIFLIICDKFSGACRKGASTRGGVTDSSKSILKALLATFIPIAAGSLVTNLTSLIDLATIMRALNQAIASAPEAFSGYAASGIPLDALPNFIFGSFTGLAVTMFNLVPSFTNMFGKGVFPAAAEAFASKDKAKIRCSGENVLFASAFTAIPAGLGITVLARPILEFLFPGAPLEAELSVMPLKILGIGVIFLSVSAAIFYLLQAAGRSDIPVKLMTIGVAVKLAGNVILVRIPALNISGAAVSTALCYFLIFILSLSAFSKITNIEKNVIKLLLFKIFYCGACCAGAALLARNILQDYPKYGISLVVPIVFGGIIYIIVTYFAGILTESTLKTLIS